MFEGLSRANRYAILYRIDIPKRPETRARKIDEFIAMLARSARRSTLNRRGTVFRLRP